MPKLAVRFTLDVDGVAKSVMGIALRPNRGDLVINIKAAKSLLEAGKIPSDHSESELHNKEIHLQRYSVHPSFDSKENINVLKQTILFVDGTSYEMSRSHTRAIKQTDRFAPVFFKLCPAMAEEKYDAPAKDPINFSLGSLLAPLRFSLFFGVFVSQKERKFDSTKGKAFDRLHPTYSICQWQIGDFNLVVLWSFIFFVPFHHAELSYMPTFTDEIDIPLFREFSDWVADGFNEDDAVGVYMGHLGMARQSMRVKATRLFGLDEEDVAFIKMMERDEMTFATPDDERMRFLAAIFRRNGVTFRF